MLLDIVKGIAYLKLNQLKNWLITRDKTSMDENWKAHCAYSLAHISKFQENPDECYVKTLFNAPLG